MCSSGWVALFPVRQTQVIPQEGWILYNHSSKVYHTKGFLNQKWDACVHLFQRHFNQTQKIQPQLSQIIRKLVHT